jgi:hypothetical protein
VCGGGGSLTSEERNTSRILRTLASMTAYCFSVHLFTIDPRGLF